MPTQDQEFDLDIGKGLDKKTDPKAVVPGKLLLLENAVFTEGHQLAKRLGYDQLTANTFSDYTNSTGTLVGPKFIKVYNNELVCADNERFYSYSPALGAWIDKGPYESIASTEMQTSAAIQEVSQSYQSSAVLGNFMLSCWQITNFIPRSFANVIDLTTGTKLIPDTEFAQSNVSGNAAPKCCVLGGTTLALFSMNGPNLTCTTFIISGNSITFSGFTNVFTAVNPIGVYDVVGTTTGGVITYNGTTKTLDTTGATTHTATGFTGVKVPSITVGPDGNIWVYGQVLSAVGSASIATVQYIVYSPTLTVVHATTAIATIGPGTGVSTGEAQNIVAVADSATQQTVIFDEFLQGTSTTPIPIFPLITKTVTVTGTVTAGTFTTDLMSILSKPFYVGTSRYLFTAYGNLIVSGSSQPGIYLFNIDSKAYTTSTITGAIVAKALYESAFPGSTSGYLPNVVQVSAQKYAINVPYLAETIIDTSGTTLTYASTLVEVDWNHQDSYQGLVFNNQLLLNGGIVQMYDGNVCAELGFNLLPQIDAAFTNGIAGNIPVSGARGLFYTAVYQWIDNQDNLHQSSAPPGTVPTSPSGSPASQQIEVDVTVPVLTGKDPSLINNISVALYRTTSGGSLFYLVDLIRVSSNPTQASSIVFIDNTSDASLILNLPLYTNGNVLGNDPPPPSLIFNSHNNRAWLVDSTSPFTAWYSKTSTETVGASFSGDLLVDIDSKGGPISGMSELDDKQIFFKADSRTVILYGDGANDTGTGSTLSAPQFMQTDVGCSASKSIISQPNGIIFKSPKGWYLLDRSTQMHYIGYPVESYNTQNVTSAIRMADKTLCVFLTSSGSTIAYDYFFDQWSVFTNHTGYAADIFQGLYTYVRTDGAIYKQNVSTFLDSTSTYLMRLQTAWIRLNKIQGFQRVKRIITLGDQLSPRTGHGIQISAAYDFINTFSTPVQYLFPSTSGPFQYREMLARQKCDTVSLLIEEVSAAAGQTGEFIDLTDIGFLAGIKKGPNKLSAANSVG